MTWTSVLRPVGIVCVLGAMLCAGWAEGFQQGEPDAKAYLAAFDASIKTASDEEKELAPTLRTILVRFFEDNGSLTPSERMIAGSLMQDLKAMLGQGDIVSRGNNGLPSFRKLRSDAKPQPAPAPKPNTTPAPAPKPKKFIPGISEQAKFTSAVVKINGSPVGVVDMSIAGKKQRVVEIHSALPGYPVDKRARIVAERLVELQKKDPLWWSTLGVYQVRGEYAVNARKAENGLLVTADASWAEQWGTTPQGLAKMLVKNIRTAIDPKVDDGIGARDIPTAEDLRIEAVRLRMEGDSLFDTSPQSAEELYRKALKADPTYAVPYLRIADLCQNQKRVEDERAVLTEALQKAQLTDKQRQEIADRIGR